MIVPGNRVINPNGARCPTCGRRIVSRGICSACGTPAEDQGNRIVVVQDGFLATSSGQAPFVFPAQEALSISPKALHLPPAASTSQEDAPSFMPNPNAIRGRVLIVRQGSSEPMDFNPWRWVAIPVWGLVLLLAPIALTILVWQTVGAMPALGVAVCSLLVLRFVFSDRLLQSWHLTAALNGRHIVQPMPVTFVRLRMVNGREVQARLKGQLAGGSLIEGDRIAVSGSWRSGVLNARRIHCERTGATIVPRQPCARGLALTGLCVLAVAALWLRLAGVPWASGQVQSFRSLVENQVWSISQRHYRP